VADAHGIERPGAAPFFAATRGLGLASTAASSAVAARVPLSLCLSTDAALVSTGACGPPPAECLLTPQLRRLLPEAGCCPSVDDAEAAWELRLGALQLLMVGGGRPSPLPPLPPHHARCREFWSAWRASGALPPRPASLLCWSEAELALLGDDFLAAAARGWRREARGVFDAHGVAALLVEGLEEERAFEEYLWAVSAVASRAFAIEQEEEEEEGEAAAAGVVLGRAAVPFIDLANHGGGKGGEGVGGAAANCRVRLSPSGFVELVRSGDGNGSGGSEERQQQQQPEEQELLISYGVDKPSRSLMERYGFCPEGGCGSDRVDWREVAGLSAAAAPPLTRDELRRAVLMAGRVGGAAPSAPPPLARAALAAAEARVLAAGSPLQFSAQHLARANKSVARLFGWRNAEEFRLAQRGSGDHAAAAAIGRALASAAEAARRRAEERAALVLAAGRNDVDAVRAELAAGYRGERGKMLMAVQALGEALAAGEA
jgi:hypothetical protein